MLYRRFLALSLFFLAGLSASAQYTITEAELTALELALTTAQAELQASQTELITLQKESLALQARLIQLSESFKEYAIEEQRKRTILVISTSAFGSVAMMLGLMAVF
jgi:hypothetical protein